MASRRGLSRSSHFPRPILQVRCPRLNTFLLTLIDALAVGSLYALIALGYTMVYGILKFINFAHSDIFVLGAWVSLSAATAAGWGDQAGVIAPWVYYVAAGLVTIGAVLAGIARIPGRQLPAFIATPAKGGLTILLAGAWAWALVGLYFLAQFLKADNKAPLLAGGVILILAMGTCGLVGFCLERLAYKPLRKAPRLNVLITAIGVSLLLQNLGQLDWMFGTRPGFMPTLLPDRDLWQIDGAPAVLGPAGEVLQQEGQPVKIRLLDIVCGGTAVFLMLALDRLVYATKLGRAMRAVSFSEKNAALMGIPVDRVISFTFVLGAMLAAAAGFLFAQKYQAAMQQTAHAGWVLLGLKAFVAAVVGGIGNIRGAMLGGLLIGLLEFFTKAYLPHGTQLADVAVFGALIVVLLVRPAGLLGSNVQEKV
jgi:branched-chain amino acid transport system permease protein